MGSRGHVTQPSLPAVKQSIVSPRGSLAGADVVSCVAPAALWVGLRQRSS